MNLQKALQDKIAEGLKEGASKLIIPDPVDWIEHEFHIPETKNDPKLRGRIQLMQYQRDVIREVFAKDKDGNFKYSIVVWSDIKKSAKSTIAAAVNIYRAHHMEFGEFYIVANDLKQAYSRVFHYAKRAVQLNPKLNSKYSISGYRITAHTGSYIEAIPIDPSGEAGGNADGISWSELWGSNERAKQDMWTEQTIPPAKYGKAFRWIESYAGFSEESDLLYSLYDLGVKQGHLLWPDRLYDVTEGEPTPLELYVNETAGMLLLWNTQPRCPWQTKKYYCLPLPENKTELMALTDNGWKPAEEIGLFDKLCTMNEGGFIEYNRPTKINKFDYSGELLRLKHHRCNIVMTPNHKIICATASHTRKVKEILSNPFEYKIIEAQEAIKSQVGWIPGHGNWNHEPLEKISVENETYEATGFIKLMAWYLSEGSVSADKRNKNIYYSRVNISQDKTKNPAKYRMITELCDELSINYKENKSGIYIYNSRLARYFHKFGVSHDKFIPRFILELCSKEQLCGFLETYILGDGTQPKNGKDHWMIYTNSDQMKLDIIELAFKAGYRPRYSRSYSSAPEKGRKPIHHIAIMKSHIGWSYGNNRVSWDIEVAQSGTTVWCPTVKNNNFYVMQNGTCWWSGNSAEEQILPPNQFQRIHRNQWVTSSETFVPMSWVYACHRTNEEWPKIDIKHHPMIVAMDAATSNDNFAIWMGCRHPTLTDEILTIYAKKWAPNKHTGKIDFQGTEDKPGPEMVLRELIKTYNVIQVAFDPYQLFDMSMRLKQEGLAWFRSFNQGTDRLVADSQLRDLIRDRRFWHRGEADLLEHFSNANAKLDDQDSKIRIVKRADRLKIDLAVAASMGSHELLRLNLA